MIYIYGALMLLCAVLAFVGNITANRMASKTSRDTTEKIRHDLFSRISYLDCEQVDKFSVSSLISRLSSDSYNVHQMTVIMQRLGVRAPILLLGGIIVTMSLEPVLTSVMIVALPLLCVLIYNISKKGIPMYTTVQKTVDKMVSKLQEIMSGVRVIKALSKSEYENNRFDEISREVVKNDRKASLTMALTNPAMSLIMNIGLCFVVGVGAFRVNSGVTKPGAIIAFLSYFTMILTAMMMVTRLFVIYSKGAASAKRIEEVLLCPQGLKAENTTNASDKENLVEFKNVSFSYNKVAYNLENISFSVKRGESLGIFGPTGCGKSTIIALLMRFYDPDKGEIYFNGINIKAYDLKELREKFGAAFQNDFIFADSIRENISFGRNLSDAEIEKAASIACADYIKEKENGFSEMLDIKGANLSGGQKQRLLIARAVAKKPEILVLDDSQSALDYKTDSILRRNIATEMKDVSQIIVSSRISSIMNCTKILCLENGKATGLGTHAELCKSVDSYRETAEIQLGASEI